MIEVRVAPTLEDSKRRRRAGAIVVACLVALASGAGPSGDGRGCSGDRSGGAETLRRVRAARLPLAFEENRGQTDESVRFTARAKGLTAFVTPEETVLALGGDPHEVVRMRFAGANPAARIESREALPGKCNYFFGSDPSRWVTNVPTCARVVVHEVRPGVDVHWYGGADGALRYDLVVAPGGDAEAVSFALEGARNLVVEDDGSLRASTDSGDLRQSRPVAFQSIDGVRRPVEAAFVVTRDGRVGFDVGAYDATRALVIDPSVTYATYLGGGGTDGSSGSGGMIAVDGSGAAYVSGFAASGFPTQSAYQATFGGATTGGPGTGDAFVTKIDAAGTAMVYSTYLGGSGDDFGRAIAVDGSGAAYVTGYTYSSNFPTQSPLQGANAGSVDTFVTKLSPSGAALVYSTYLGGSGSELYGAYGIAVDGSGAAYVTGNTGSTDFPLQSALQGSSGGGGDVYVAKLNSSGSALVYSTYLGGSGSDYGRSIAVDSSGAAYVTGTASSGNFPTQGSLQGSVGSASGAFVTKIDAAGSGLVHSTILGGATGWGIAVDSSGAAYMTGWALGSGFPIQSAFQPSFAGPGNGLGDAVVAKIAADGSALVWSTFLGGGSAEAGYGIAVDATGAATVVGITGSTDFPTVSPSQASYGGSGGGADTFVTKFRPDGSALEFSTYLGGSSPDTPWGVALDGVGDVYVGGVTRSSNFPVQSALQATFGGGVSDAYIAKFPLGAGSPLPSPAPDAPVNLTANYVGGAGIVLAWEDESHDESAFRVERRPTGYSFAHLVTTGANATTHADGLLYPTVTYTYRVRAQSTNGQSAWSNEASATVPIGDFPVPPPPRAPSQLTATADVDASNWLSWTDNSSDEVLFELDRAMGAAAFGRLASVRTDVTSFADYDLHPGWPCKYRVRALALQGPSPWSNVAVATLPPTLDVTVVSGKLTDWKKAGRGTLKLAATFAFGPSSASGAVLDPVGGGLELQLGAANAPISVSIAPGDPTWKVKRKKGRPVAARWRSGKGVLPKVTIVADLARRRLTAAVSRADLGEAPDQLVRVLVASGPDGGGQAATWTLRKPGVLRWR